MKIKLGLGKENMRNIAEYCSGELYDFTGEIGLDFGYVCTDAGAASKNLLR